MNILQNFEKGHFQYISANHVSGSTWCNDLKNTFWENCQCQFSFFYKKSGPVSGAVSVVMETGWYILLIVGCYYGDFCMIIMRQKCMYYKSLSEDHRQVLWTFCLFLLQIWQIDIEVTCLICMSEVSVCSVFVVL